MQPRSLKQIFVGFVDGPKAIRYYDAKTRQIWVSRNYKFLSSPGDFPKQVSDVQCEGEINMGELDAQTSGGADAQSPISEHSDKKQYSNSAEHILENGSKIQESTNNKWKEPPDNDNMPRRTKRQMVRQDYQKMNDPDIPDFNEEEDNESKSYEVRHGKELPLPKLTEADIVLIAMVEGGHIDPNEPKNLKEAKASTDWLKWEEAIQSELTQLDEMGTWELVEPPKDRTLVGNKWVLVKKTNKEGEIVKYKARLVAKGYSQIPGMDYTDTFAPVVRLKSIHSTMSVVAALDWEVEQMDVKGAYLNGTLTEEVYMVQLEGYKDGTGRVCRLRKTLYGLKQSGREWNIELNSRLTRILGFKCTESEPCIYIRKTESGTQIITVWVDDLLLFANSINLMSQLKTQLKKILDVTDLGEPKKIVGIEITRNRAERTIKLSQARYIDLILAKHGLQDCNKVGMPMDPKIVLEREDTDAKGDRSNSYASLVGSLMYLAVATRPDIAYAIQRLSSFAANPGLAHWSAAK